MAPRKRGGGSRGGLSFIFCCFNGSDHPEITYRLREDFALQVMEPALPMPGYDELDSMFSELVVRIQTCPTNLLFHFEIKSVCYPSASKMSRQRVMKTFVRLDSNIYVRNEITFLSV